jgi:hypothetical protein
VTIAPHDRRWVVLGLANPRSAWFTEVARWANASAIPVDFVKCVSAHEVRARLTTGRAYSALLVGSELPALDRDLVDTSRAAGAAVIVVGGRRRDWVEVGVSAALPEILTRSDLMAALTDLAPPIARVDTSIADDGPDPETGWRGHMVAVTGPGGAGSSVVAMALAQGLAADASNRGLVILADLALDADQAMLHDARDVVPGIQELVEGHRGGRLGTDQVRAGVFDATDRGYHLLLGLRRHRDWTVLRPRALDAAIHGLQRSYRVVVADVEPDIEGESQTGSIDIEDRNLLARSVLFRSDLTVVVGRRHLKGLHSLTRTVGELIDGGVDPERMIVAVNRAPKSPRHRAEITSTVVEMLRNATRAAPLDNPVFIPDRRDVEAALHDGVRLPAALGRNITSEVRRRLADLEPRNSDDHEREPVAVAAGSLGHWTGEVG